MQEYQNRVIEEKTTLDDKINKLSVFIEKSNIFLALPREEKALMSRQLELMRQYSSVLGERISSFKDICLGCEFNS